MTQFGNAFMHFSQWVYRIMTLNWLWFLYILRGGIVLGFFPATCALLEVTKSWQEEALEKPFKNRFIKTYWDQFALANKVGWLYALGLLFLVWDLYLVLQIKSILGLMSTFAVLTLFAQYLLLGVYGASFLAINGPMSTKPLVKQALGLSFSSLKSNAVLTFGLMAIVTLYHQMPGLLPFAAGVLPAFWSVKVTKNLLKKQGGTFAEHI